jgi:hypothetical protein
MASLRLQSLSTKSAGFARCQEEGPENSQGDRQANGYERQSSTTSRSGSSQGQEIEIL